MDKIIEIVLKDLVRRIEILEGKNPTNNINKINPINNINRKPGIKYASQAQIDFARRLGGDPWEGITFKDVGEMIDERKLRIEQKKSESVNKSYSESPEEIEKKFNKEFEKTKLKPLTQKEIDEIGEDALM